MVIHFISITGIIVLYSFILNLFFGHRQFWKISTIKYSLMSFRVIFWKFIDQWVSSLVTRLSTNKFLRKHLYQPVQKCRMNGVSIVFLPEDVALQCLSFLDCYSLSTLSSVSKHVRLLTQNDTLWISLCERLLRSVPSNLHNGITFEDRIFSNAMHYYFYTVFRLPFIIGKFLEPRSISTILNGCLYDLTNFAHEHPGGEDILLQWNCRDSTRIFNLANHSQFALQLQNEFLIWTPISTLGKYGYPNSMKFLYEEASTMNN
mmetsp:Transcript_13478/g.20204  ORF Transcript_13478/g.20204 Transcript_13478/m.20204 type:complete len:261 (+) Transcript_13478:32-814(+)